MPDLIFVDNDKLFKIVKSYPTQLLCLCSMDYQQSLGIKIGDYLFLRDKHRTKTYDRIGQIKAFGNSNKVILGYLPDIGLGSKKRMIQQHLEDTVEFS